MTSTDLPYWLVNVPEDQRSSTCPDFLVNASAKDQRILSTPDRHYHVLTWAEVQDIVQTNRIDRFQRVPSELRRYLAYNWKLRSRYGSVMAYMLQGRIKWTNITPNDPTPFADPADLKVLYNNWPYGIDPRIVHLVVWTKFDLEDDAITDDLTPEARKQIDDYVDRTFRSRVSPEHVLWFKNWKSLKSIHAVEHFHVMVFDPPEDFLREITNNDVREPEDAD